MRTRSQHAPQPTSSSHRRSRLGIGIGIAMGTLLIAFALIVNRVQHNPFSHPTSTARATGVIAAEPKSLVVEVIRQLPHDPTAFTQGLLSHKGRFYESTGLYGQSTIRITDPESGEVLKRVDVPGVYFGEGLALHRGSLIQLTWREQTAFVYDAETLRQIATLTYDGEGWGLASNGTDLFLTDGSSVVRVVDDELRTLRTIRVRDTNGPVGNLNEIEWYNGTLLANIWQSDLIAQIDPVTGDVLAWIDCSPLMPPHQRVGGMDVLNGIAYDTAKDCLFLTGKNWPSVFEVRLRTVE